MSIAIVILNWNGKHWLEQFLPSVCQRSDGASIYVADNASTDDSVRFVKDNFPQVNIIQNDKNAGYAGGYNEALKQISEDIYILMNSDIEPDANWLPPIKKMFESHPEIAAIQPKILAYKQKTHFEYAGASGGYIDRFGYPFCRGRLFDQLEKDDKQYDSEAPIFWATGACLCIRRAAYWEAGGLDEDFFAHMEEIDLCWRLHHKGHQIYVCPKAVVYHVGGGTLNASNPKKTYLNFRNGLFLLFKNLPNNRFFGAIFIRMVLDGLAGLQFLMQGKPSHTLAIIKAHFSFYASFSQLRTKRNAIGEKFHFRNSPIVYQKSLVFQFFLKKKKTFAQLGMGTVK